MPTPYDKPITVNLRATVNATGDIEVFGSGPDAETNDIIVAVEKLPVNALYDATKNIVDGVTMGAGLIEFWEPSSDLGNIHAALAGYDASSTAFNFNGAKSYEGTAKVLASGLQKVLCGDLNCANAAPFKASKYNVGGDDYRVIPGFGRVALGAYADKLFGHIAATAAITNDEAFMNAMLSLNDNNLGVKANGTKEQRYAAWKHLNDVNTKTISQWGVDRGNYSDAKLALALANTIVKKGLTYPTSSTKSTSAAGVTNSTDTLANIVKQVIGQDASRAKGQDNNALAPEVHQVLRFYSGDKIRVSITLEQPNEIKISDNAGTSQQGEPKETDFTQTTYAIEIELGDRDAFFDSVSTPSSGSGSGSGSAPATSYPLTITNIDPSFTAFSNHTSLAFTTDGTYGVADLYSIKLARTDNAGARTLSNMDNITISTTSATARAIDVIGPHGYNTPSNGDKYQFFNGTTAISPVFTYTV